MDLSYQHSHHQRILRQRNLLFAAVAALGAFSLLLLTMTLFRGREIVLQPVLRSPLTISSSGVSRDYLEMITRDVVVLTLDRNPQNLEYWMESVLAIASPRAQGKLKADLMRIVEEQRGSSISQFFTIQSMTIDTKALSSEVTGELHTIVGSKVVSKQLRTFRYRWEYAGLTLRLIGFGMVEDEKGHREKGRAS
ncbi:MULTISPECIES: type IV conjugative transfer system protein TraE [Sphingobium]|uniref:Conjugal transfer protein TraE n=2 Tax=Sphingobium TaxID=165695 RepID=A0A0M3AHQ1_9SPHN|nr:MULTISPECIES: type IV conjugative transfer system protein TraE [Sphingobium]OAP30386.1 conjugal transfer protein TraE [Sphingobium sp. 20006FA]KKW89355.1 conjugal transfer protein TraE [Sphingobium chungbukense]KXU30838.1 conjugal transfer protein TraE [Sphingobium sp. AM]KYC30665.1 conjugal transfer protein TraE [Sphingobium sp. 22B]MCB4859000.1 type IV conjugative transfer system protein TraE [Sphingobium sp. PNB]